MNPTLNDVGIAKINEGTAIDAVSYYKANLSDFGGYDSLDLVQYDGRPASLVTALIDDPDVNVKIQAIISRQAQDFFEQNDPNFNLRSESSQTALITSYSVLGENFIRSQYDKSTNQGLYPQLYNPSTGGDGGQYITFPGNMDSLIDVVRGMQQGVDFQDPTLFDRVTEIAGNLRQGIGQASIDILANPSAYTTDASGAIVPLAALGLNDPYSIREGAADPFQNASASQLAGIGISLTSDLGEGGYASYGNFDFIPGQTTNSVFDYYGMSGYAPEFNYSGTDYFDYSAYNFSGDDFSSFGQFGGGYDPFQSFAPTDFGNFNFSFDSAFPIVLDLVGTGIKIDPAIRSTT
ncbi:MAG: hypothetical protein H7Y09_12705 [Chitinophagaceae bacterium]|nr:hypothetical protein [Anaerolineae bacterium]